MDEQIGRCSASGLFLAGSLLERLIEAAHRFVQTAGFGPGDFVGDGLDYAVQKFALRDREWGDRRTRVGTT